MNTKTLLVDSIERGIKKAEDLSPVSFYGWCVQKLHNRKTDWKPDKLHASDLKYTIKEPEEKGCPRQLWHRFYGSKKRKDSLGTKIMWDQGRAMQYRFSYYLSLGLPKDWTIIGIEKDVSKGLPETMTGHADLVIGNSYQIFVIEIKTQRGRSFKHLDKPKLSHVIQMQTYVDAMKNIYYPPTDNMEEISGKVLYLDREGQNTPVEFDASLRLDLAHSHKKLQQILDRDKPSMMKPILKIRKNKGPNSIYLKQPWQCKYCEYRDISCDSALDKDCRTNSIVAKIYKDGLKHKQNNQKLINIVEQLLKGNYV